MIRPHGGQLVDKTLSSAETEKIINSQKDYFKLELDEEQVKDVRNIANGAYSPLGGFLKEKDFKKVVSEMRLADETIWPIPIVLDVSKEIAKKLKKEKEILLVDKQKKPIAILKDVEVYSYDKDFFTKNIFGTTDPRHPGVEGVYQMGDYLVGGEIDLLDNTKELFPEYNFTPAETRKIFQGRGWKEVVAFQTRNVPHCGHEFLQLRALDKVDGLFVQPVIGEKKLEDFKDEYIIASYEILIDKYYPKNKAVLGILPLKMRYAGPREAVFHAIIRKNFGCTHFIVGRDHAGAGSYYPPFAAQEIFDSLDKSEMEIEIMKFPEVVFNKEKEIHCFVDECPEEHKISFSGTFLREKIKNRELPPAYLIREEVYNLLTNTRNSLVDSMYKDKNRGGKRGFVLWFTGLPSSGKSTIADKVYEILEQNKMRVERLDGDVIRENLTKDLGFSKEDRDENIRRVGFVAKMLSRNGVGVIASFISPYKQQRDDLRMKIENFIEVFVNTPLEVCEQRDRKGLYIKARKGEIKNFTGISDPYEEPENSELELRPGEKNLDECVAEAIEYLKVNKFI